MRCLYQPKKTISKSIYIYWIASVCFRASGSSFWTKYRPKLATLSRKHVHELEPEDLLSDNIRTDRSGMALAGYVIAIDGLIGAKIGSVVKRWRIKCQKELAT